MKLRYICLLLATLGTGACTDVLEKQPIGQTTDQTFFKTQEDAVASVTAAYDVLQWEETGAWHPEWMWGDIASDDATKGGENEGDQVGVYEMEKFMANGTNRQSMGLWKAYYQGIYRANLSINNIPGIEMDQTLKTRLVAEAKFLRAFYYFRLVRTFGGVPLVTKVLAPSEYNTPRATAQEVYKLIEQDLKDAAQVLPVRTALPASDYGRATKGAAEGMLMRVYVYQNKWPEAKQMGEKVIGSGQYALMEKFEENFTLAGEFCKESLFEINFFPTDGGWGNANEGSVTPVFCGPRSEGGWGFNQATTDLVNSFEAGDPRKEATVTKKYDDISFGTGYFGRKYTYTWDNGYSRPTVGDGMSNGGVNWRVLRYADVLLMQAEACYHTGEPAKAVGYVNEVRTRARAGKSVLADLPQSLQGQSLLNAIYRERRSELAMEGLRFWDLVRTDRAATVLAADGFRKGVSELFPIPEYQIRVTNGAITQNPGYN